MLGWRSPSPSPATAGSCSGKAEEATVKTDPRITQWALLHDDGDTVSVVASHDGYRRLAGAPADLVRLTKAALVALA